MPKRLLRYALSRLELLDADALDMDNLDFALGRNTVFEFRDVGIKLKKLEKLLQLPAAIQLSRAKVLLLRVTVPMDFYTSPITVEVEGVEVRLKVDGAERDNPGNETPLSAAPPADVVPNTVDLAQSFLEMQPSSERKRLEEALVAETQDLGASVSVSDDDCGSEDEPNAFGTGQALSLPDFLADFLQGIVDRTQIKIRCVRFQLDMEVPAADTSSPSALEPVSFQIALESIEVEGVTTAVEGKDSSVPAIVPKEGKRHISLANVRACLISEANVFSALSRSPSMPSPSTASSSPVMTRTPPSRQSTSLLSQGSFREQPMASLQESFRERLSVRHKSPDLEEHPLGDSEEALGIPYEFDDESPPTPRASTLLQEPSTSSRESSISTLAHEQQQEPEQLNDASALEFDHGRLPLRLVEAGGPDGSDDDSELSVPLPGHSRSMEDLTESHLYTHEEAESMYLSAFSTAEPGASASVSRLALSQENDRGKAVVDLATPAAASRSPRSIMPGAWGEESESPRESQRRTHERAEEAETALPASQNASSVIPLSGLASDSGHSEPGARPPETEAEGRLVEQDDTPTPRGPSRVVKEIMHLENVSIYVPSHHRHIQVQTGVPPQPGTAQQPPSSTASTYSEPLGTAASSKSPSAVYDDAVEVVLSPLHVYFDTSLGILIAMAFDKLLKAVKYEEPASVGKPRRRQAKNEVKRVPEFRFMAQEMSFNFLSQLNGVADIPGRHLNPSPFIRDHDDVLLNATLQNLAVSTSSTRVETPSASGDKGSDPASQDAVVTKIDLERFRFGYADSDMISFDSRPMTTSVRDVFLSDGHDVGIKMIHSDGLSKTDVETLPLVVQLDLQRLDETIGWFGGLSSFLNMSVSSATSGISRSSSPVLKPVVHFEAPSTYRRIQHSVEDSRSAVMKNKINVRVGGALVELAGRECSVAAETNAIKVVGRDQGIGVACGRIRFMGPYLKTPYTPTGDKNNDYRHHHHYQTPPLTTEVGGLRLELSPVPEDRDLEKLLELIIPSKVKFDDDGGGEIMVETLLRQRRKGSVLRVTVETVNVRVGSPAQLLPALPNLVEEIAKLSTTVAAKYLPEDDRPGILTLTRLQKLDVSVNVGDKIGLLESQLNEFEVAHITVPSLVAVAVRGVSIRRNGDEDLICSDPVLQGQPLSSPEERGPVIMARIIGDEMEPIIKVKLRELRIEYRVPTIMDALGLDNDSATPQEFEASLAASVASLAERARLPLLRTNVQITETASEQLRQEKEKPTALDVGLRDCLLGLNPLNLSSKLVLALTDARVQADLPSSNGITTAAVHINKASLLLTDNFAETEVVSTSTGAASRAKRRRHSASAASPQIADMCARGFVDICYISSARIAATVKPTRGDDGPLDNGKQVEVELRDDLLVLETCADSTQTLIALFNALKPPTPPSRDDKYRTKVVPVQDLLASISAEAFGKPEGDYDFDHDFAGAQELAGSLSDADYGSGSRLLPHGGSDVYDSQLGGEELFDATAHGMSIDETTMQDTAEGVLLTGFDHPSQNESSVNDSGDDLVIHEDFYGRDEGASESQTAKLWNSVKNTYDRAPDALFKSSPLRVSVKDVHVIWNLFDGYDWARTRDVITKAVEDVEVKATERQQQKNKQQSSKIGGGSGLETYEEQDEDEETIGDFLFNSIYIGVPLNRDPRELTRAINKGLNDEDDTTETESVATTTTTATKTAYLQSMQGRHRRGRRLRLHRSKHHKITFELQGVSADVVAYPPPEATAAGVTSRGGQETLSSIDVRVQTLDIFDHVPTSTWKKFATYDQDQGEREMGTSMVHLELLNVRPIPDLAASEIVMRAKVLPLRLHVDQDALDFITRFFEFKDEQGAGQPPLAPASTSASDIPFLQRAEVLDIPVKLDFKPKRVDYAGLRSGHTTEFMNFIVLEEARMVLRHVIVYGVSGFDRLGKTLNDIWTPDVRRNQLPGVVAGLAPVRSLVNIGSGFRDLVEIPLKEYRKDGRVVRSISKGAAAFARTTGTELVKLGAKLAVGTQYALQGAEEMLLAERATEGGREADEDDEDYDDADLGGLDDEDKKQISLYADQPTGVLQGIRGGYRSLTRDVNLARDAIIAVPGEVMESQSAGGAARAVLRRAPTIIFRPAVGVTKAIGQTLLGATNTMDPQNRRRIGEKYKH
ncbi:autophagy-related protein [Hirsutella rhossiliensis]|uniref:Autophagy-related protein 2 n=1 Tax=Hirsutella rhossiliensis TaxID=111463 RepID=A0A9P8SF02_9HYPO|nr:autophagy-related protein [Hirsutella rhossiliensis]KAH0959569.1 autophagy-related protein [Hirsutella rhossiliensis]